MRSRKLLVGLAALGLPALLTVVTAVLNHPWLPEVGLAVLLMMIGALLLDTNKRARSRYGARPLASPQAAVPATNQEDLLGVIRLLQAQYVGRLDRAQDSLELATAALLSASERGLKPDDPAHPASQSDRLFIEQGRAGAPRL